MHTVLKPFEKFYFAPLVCSRLMSSRGVPGVRAYLLWRTVDGGWWWMVVVDGGGWSKKKFFDFAQNLFRWSLGDINVRKFGKSVKNFFYREKNPTSIFKKWGYFCRKKGSPISLKFNSGWVIGVFFFKVGCFLVHIPNR